MVQQTKLQYSSEYNIDMVHLGENTVKVMGEKDAEPMADYRRYCQL